MRTRQNLLSEKKLLPHAKTTKPNRSPSVTGWASNQFTRPGRSRSSRYRVRCAPAYPGYRAALSLNGRPQHHAQIAHTCAARQHQARILHPRNATPSGRPAHAISQQYQSQTRPAYPALGRAGCLPACPSYAPGPRRPLPRGLSPRCRSGSRRTACPPR